MNPTRVSALLSVSILGLGLGLVAAGCGEAEGEPTVPGAQAPFGEEGKADSSAIATFLDFEFEGKLVTSSTSVIGGARTVIQDQLLYTIGHLNANRSVGRLDRLEISNIVETRANGRIEVAYHAKMPVAWGSKTNLPTTYQLRLPYDVSSTALQSFTDRYMHDCVDFGAHDVTPGSMWYYYRPAAAGCQIDEVDVIRTDATVTVSQNNTTGKYPEYQKIYEDGALKIVAIFGKNEDGKTEGDVGIDAYNNFVRAVRSHLAPLGGTTVPEAVPATPGVAFPDVTLKATMANGKTVEVTALLVDNVRTGSPDYDFTARYNALSTRADLIMYNGHAGLGQNVRALANKGTFVAGQYQIIFMNGCDTFAYVDGSLAQTRARLNPDDPTGTKYMDIVTNAMPAFFSALSNTTMAMVKGLMSVDAPKTYEEIFRNIDSSQVVLVTGEQDNVFVPQMSGGFAGMRETGTVTRGQIQSYETPELAPGEYIVKLAPGTGSAGDADLYVRAGQAPTTTAYDCRPYKNGSDEECRVSLTQSRKIFVQVRGFSAAAAGYVLTVN